MRNKQEQAIERLQADTRLLVKAEDICDVLGCNPQSIRDAVQAERDRSGIPAIILGSRVLIKRIPFLVGLGINATKTN